jgi:hypothetical protein
MILVRSDVIAKIEEHLAGRLGVEGLAAWAFDRFYEIDQGDRSVNPEDAEVVADVLDALMFADNESFAPDEADLQRLLARLQQP